VRVRAEEGLAELRHGARQGVRPARIAVRNGVGLFAAALLARFPLLRSRRKAACRIRGCATTSSSASSPTAASVRFSPADGPSAGSCSSTRRTSCS